MRFSASATFGLAASAVLGVPAYAHHSMAMFDNSQEVIIEGTVTRFDWMNPHTYLYFEAVGPEGQKAVIQGEGLAVTQAIVDGLRKDALQPGMRVVVRANPNRGGWGKQVRLLDVTTEDGEIHPFYAANTRTRTLTPAQSLAGRWAPARAALGAAFGAMARWPVTPEGRAAQSQMAADGLCFVEPIPFLAVLDEMRSIEINGDQVLLHFDNSGDHVLRTVYMNAEHPADLTPSLHGHSVGRWEGDTLVIDTIGYEPNASGLGMNTPSSSGKRTIERLTLTEDRTRLRYEITVEDPTYLSAPSTLTQQWDHRPDLEFSPPGEACDPEVAKRYLENN